jgi:hypothetical protein
LAPVDDAVSVSTAPLGIIGADELTLEFAAVAAVTETVGLAIRLMVTVFEYAETPAFVTFLR